MNTRVSFLMVALLLLVCYVAPCQEPPALPEPVLAVQRCFPQATIRPLPEVQYNGEIVPQPWAFTGSSTISPDGRRLFFRRSWEKFGLQSNFLDLTTGQVSLAKMPDQQQLKYLRMPLPYMYTGVWDPVDPAYLYAMVPDDIKFNPAYYRDYILYSIWRVNVETLVGQQILPPSTNSLCDITPDGHYLLFDSCVEEGIYHPCLYSLEAHTWTPLPEDMTLAEEMEYGIMRTLSPNGELVAGFRYDLEQENTALTIMDVTTDRLLPAFNQNQVLFVVPHGSYPLITGAPTWLFNSAGLFVNIRPLDADMTENTIWHVGINGEARPIASGVAMLANSQNGRHWLLQHDQQFYVMAVEDEAPEE